MPRSASKPKARKTAKEKQLKEKHHKKNPVVADFSASPPLAHRRVDTDENDSLQGGPTGIDTHSMAGVPPGTGPTVQPPSGATAPPDQRSPGAPAHAEAHIDAMQALVDAQNEQITSMKMMMMDLRYEVQALAISGVQQQVVENHQPSPRAAPGFFPKKTQAQWQQQRPQQQDRPPGRHQGNTRPARPLQRPPIFQQTPQAFTTDEEGMDDDTPTYQHAYTGHTASTHHQALSDEMEQERVIFRRTQGRAAVLNDIYVTNPIAKPYMYIQRAGVKTAIAKQQARTDMTYQEYIGGFLAMLKDGRVWDPDTFWQKFDHLCDISREAVARPWAPVRAWSQRTFDRIETLEITWADTNAIQEDKHSYSVDEPQSGAPTAPTTGSKLVKQGNRTIKSQGEVSVICAKYGKGQCDQEESHSDGTTYFEHACMYCYCMGGSKFHHPLHKCEKKTGRRNNNRSGNNNNQYGGQSKNE